MVPLSDITEVDYIWKNGELVPWAEATTHVLSHSLHYGSGVFEGIRCYKVPDEDKSYVFRLRDHMERLHRSCKIAQIELPYSVDELMDATLEVIRANRLPACYIRPLVYRGYGVMGVDPTGAPVDVVIAVWPWGAYLGPEALEMGIRAKTSSFARMHVNTLMSKAKAAGNYVNSILAKIEAKEDGYDEAVMLDTNGFVSEATGENIFIVRDGIIKTTPWTSILGGITRDSVMKVARDLGYTVEEQQFTRDELYIADEAFFTGTAAEITPIREVDNRTIGAGHAGPVTKHLQKEYFGVVKGQNAKYADWLSHYTF